MGNSALVSIENHRRLVDRISHSLKESNGTVTRESDGHVFGLPKKQTTHKLDLKNLSGVIHFTNEFICVQASCKVKHAMNMLAKHDLTLAVPVDLLHLTFGGLVAGVGGGCTSFRCGWFHSQIRSLEVVLANGDVIQCTGDSDDPHSDLFWAVPNSLGTLGYVTKMCVNIEHRSRFVSLHIHRYSTSKEYFSNMKRYANNGTQQYLEGTILDPRKHEKAYILLLGYKTDIRTCGRFYNYRDVFWEILEDNTVQVMDWYFDDFHWRWDRDLYFTSKEVATLQNPVFRSLVPKNLKNSDVYRWYANTFGAHHTANAANDVFIPIDKAADFDNWFHSQFQLYPIYICPVRCNLPFTLWPKTNGLLVDFGVAYGVNHENERPHLLEQMEKTMNNLGGRKLLYTKVNVNENTMWSYLDVDRDTYKKLKDKYDPTNRLLTLYQKVIV